jgi:uncharacterized lipoprotein NlpE involved in copper resistance
MKKFIFTALMAVAALSVMGAEPQADTTAVKSPSIVRDSLGNFVQTAKSSVKAPYKVTGYTFTAADGKKYPVFEGANGGLFYVKISTKTGKTYKVYLPKV